MKILHLIGIIILASIAFTFVIPLISLFFGLGLLYYAYKAYPKSNRTMAKIFWVIIFILGISIAMHSFPAIIGVVAIVALVRIGANYKRNKMAMDTKHYDVPFTEFEKEWSSIMKKHK